MGGSVGLSVCLCVCTVSVCVLSVCMCVCCFSLCACFLSYLVMWHTGLGTLGMVGQGQGQHTSTSFAQEWILNNCLLFGNTKVCYYN